MLFHLLSTDLKENRSLYKLGAMNSVRYFFTLLSLLLVPALLPVPDSWAALSGIQEKSGYGSQVQSTTVSGLVRKDAGQSIRPQSSSLSSFSGSNGKQGLRFSAHSPMAQKPSENLPPANTVGEEETGIFSNWMKRVKQTWRSGKYDIYIPAYSWHNRLMYDKDKVRQYNENPWGFGIGKSITDEDGDWHSLYIMGFMDSYDKFEPYGGYAFVKNWRPGEQKDFALGAGFTLGVTGRYEYYYIPLPLPLPVVSLEYKDISVQAAYIPGGHNDGNVLFTWLRWHID
ncbi:lipid IV(A) palmitoyltransferase PagP [Desulfovibrio sp. OttesenSCG-928-G15]|nr:lipid IV(A) palmitoyltransferase PagP [Desulfovibrio sp. OttesenSCG-928-G15]